MTKMSNPLFNINQQRALAALHLPVWHKREAQTEAEVKHCYRLGEWLLVFSQQLSVPKPQWLLDIACLLDCPIANLAELSARQITEWPRHRQLALAVDETGALSADVKRDLWRKVAEI